MLNWAPRDVIERVGEGLSSDMAVKDIANREALHGAVPSGVKGGLAGLTLGALAGRLAGGEKSLAPIKDMYSKGITKETFKGLGKVPGVMKAMPLIGAGLGVGTGLGLWGKGYENRIAQARDVATGLLAEQIIQRGQLQNAANSIRPLSGLPRESASYQSPRVVVTGNMGV